ncbi:MAG: citrate synthase [Oscillospiraceae bacterium]|nr:citrate synthase [Oscillospiraceae bacterium]MDE5852968.1 citrate synthase [Oscillospiraceae bacterium]
MPKLAPNYGTRKKAAIDILCKEFKKNNHIEPELFSTLDVKRGLRNADGTGVLAGLTLICNVHGYVIDEGEKKPIEGELIYRGYNIKDIVNDCMKNKRFGFEEVIYLLLFGTLPNEEEINYFKNVLAMHRELPEGFTEDVILKKPSKNIMNKMQSALLSMYTYDNYADSTTIEQELRKAIEIIARIPTIMISSYQAKCKAYDKKSLVLHPINPKESIAQSILSTLRLDRKYTPQEAHLLDMMLMLHAEHGGGNNSTFVCRCLTSSGTDAYSAYAGAIGALKGPKHGGANNKVMLMLNDIKQGVHNWEDKDEIRNYLCKIMDKKAGDGSGLIYGMGHAVYTKSDPRALILKKYAMELAKGTEYEPQFKLLQNIEALSPSVFAEKKNDTKVISANVDMYSGLVYKMLGIPEELFTPLFATARIAGWAAHRMEENLTGGRIIRPAYKAVTKEIKYKPMSER